MKISESFNSSIKSLLQNKIRFFLTALGVLIGVFAVVTLISLVRGVENFINKQFEELGSNVLYVYPGAGGLVSDPATFFSDNELSKKDVENIKRDAKGYYKYLSPIIAAGQRTKYKNRDYFATLIGGNTDIFGMFNINMENGRGFNNQERNSKQKVAVIGSYVKEKLFKQVDPVNKKITVGDSQFLVIGHVKEKSEDFNKMVMIPDTTLEKVLDYSQYTYISVSVPDDVSIDDAKRKIELALLKDLDDDDFTVFTQEDFLETVTSILDIIKISLIAIAGISLLVGGIGIMNIMLVSVTERIKEVGLRKALGATPRNIAFQFLVESVLVSIVGGVLGLLLGWAVTKVAQRWIQAEIEFWVVLLSFGFSTLVGVVFGTYPAVKASKLDPIEALRYE